MARPPMFIDCPDGSRVWFDPSLSDDTRAWMIEEERARWARSEPVTLADGPELQHLVPSVAAVPLPARQIAQEAQRRAARRSDAPLPSGGLFDDAARLQQDLFV